MVWEQLQAINRALTPRDIRENPGKYGHFTATNAAPGKAKFLKWGLSTAKWAAGGAAAATAFTGIQAVMQPYISYQSSKASTEAKYGTELAPRPQYQGRSYIGQSSLEMGRGLMTGYGEQFIPNIQASSAEQARLYQEYSPAYTQVAVDKIWAEQQARYEANLAFPTFPAQSTAKANQKMPYTPIVK